MKVEGSIFISIMSLSNNAWTKKPRGGNLFWLNFRIFPYVVVRKAIWVSQSIIVEVSSRSAPYNGETKAEGLFN